jgi:type I restriction enzyme R subunit
LDVEDASGILPPTHFLPFNKGRDTGAGNPDNPKGFKTDYLWREVWQRDSLLEILNHFVELVDDLDDDGKPTGKKKLIFPRYHQLDSVRRMIADAKAKGAGQNYLIEHSAGSGKSNSIAWLAHRLSCLSGADDKPIFDSVIVITDRRVLDWQLQQTVRSFEHVKGVVTTIEKRKAVELTEALTAGKRLIVSTLQSFPGVAKKIGEMPGKRFAVIVDEAHSSQTGETTRNMREILVAPSLEEAEKAEAVEGESDEDAVNKAVAESMKAHGRLKNVSFFAFTATPKPKTLELFGTKRPDGRFQPFSLYSMRQAIDEKFILDVLQNYTTFQVYFGLQKKIEGDPKYPKKKGIYLLKSYADLHPHRIDLKTEIMVEHFHENVANRIDKRAKAMVVTRSRLHAVRFKIAFDKYLREHGYPYKALVAFSGKVKDPDSGETFTESGMNGFPDSQTAQTFKLLENRFLIVAEKFQTGFDQPLLQTMYVDKKLGGVNAVQTLSRLNRTLPPLKEDTMVLDFANGADEIQKAFQPFYQCTLLTEATDPNKLYDFKRVLEEFHMIETNFELYKKVNGDPVLAELLRTVLFKKVESSIKVA